VLRVLPSGLSGYATATPLLLATAHRRNFYMNVCAGREI
jgi:hypothetical protein